MSAPVTPKKMFTAEWLMTEFPCRFHFPIAPDGRLVDPLQYCPMGPWRAQGATALPGSFRSFIDELAHAVADAIPVELRLELLGTQDMVDGIGERGRKYNAARMRGVVKKVAELSQWGKSMPKGSGQGIAFHFSHQGYVAEVATG